MAKVIRLGGADAAGQGDGIKVFLDFEASSLSDRSHTIEVGWIFEDGVEEAHLIAPAPGWEGWDAASEAVHGIARQMLLEEREPHGKVAARMLEMLSGHEMYASAPSWDGKWLSALLRSAGHPRHALRLRDTEDALRASAMRILRPALPCERLDREVHNLVSTISSFRDGPPAHRALDDARFERAKWLQLEAAARDLAEAV